MPLRAVNGVPIGANYSAQATLYWPFTPGATKLDVFVSNTDAVVQFLEEPNSAAWTDDQNLEALCRQGFNSIPVETPFYAVRFRVWSGTLLGTSGSVDVRMLQ